MSKTNLLLIDLQDSFAIITEKRKIKIEYGLYSMMIGSLSYDNLIKIFNSNDFQDLIGTVAELRSTHAYMGTNQFSADIQEKCISYIKENIASFYTPLYKLLDTGHLKKQQLSCITELFLHEFTEHMLADYFQRNDKYTYIPSVLYHEDFRLHIKSLLLRNTKNLSSSLQQEMNNLEITTTITMYKNFPYTVYHITNTLDFLLLDLQKYLTGKKNAKECEYCERFFYPVQRSSAKYCRLPHKNTDKTCDYIMHHRPKDELEELYNTAKRQQAKKRDYPANIDKYGYELLDKFYQDWKTECDQKYAIARRTKDKTSFQQWIEKSKFKKKRLEELYANEQKADQ